MSFKNILITAAAICASLTAGAQGVTVERPTSIRPFTTATVAFLQSNDPNEQEETALEFFRTAYPKGKVLTAERVVAGELDGITSLWIHCDRAGMPVGADAILAHYSAGATPVDTENPDADTSNDFLSSLTTWAKAGGSMYLSGQATQFVDITGRKNGNEGQKEFAYGCNANTVEVNGNINIGANCNGGHRFHAIYGSPEFTEQQLADNKYIVQQFVPLLDGENGIWPVMAPADGTPIYYDDNNSLWVTDNTDTFQNVYNCIQLGTWGHGDGNFNDILGIVEFLPGDGWNGNIIANGIGGCEWAPSATSAAAVKAMRAESAPASPNKYIENIKRLAFNSINYLAKAYNTPPTSGIENIEADRDCDADAPAEYFTLQGVHVAEPANGIFICRRGDKVTKIKKF